MPARGWLDVLEDHTNAVCTRLRQQGIEPNQRVFPMHN